MPVPAQIERLIAVLDLRLDTAVDVFATELEDLDEVERDAAIDAIVAGEPSPLVICGGRVVCTGSVDAGAVVAALI